MLLWIFIAILVLGIAWAIFDWFDMGECAGAALFLVGFVLTGISLGITICENVCADGEAASLRVEYEMLTYQYENDIYENDNDIGKRDLFVAIQEYNEKIARCKVKQRDLWVGVFIPNIYDQFELIEIDK